MSETPKIAPALTPEEWARVGLMCGIVPIGLDGTRGAYALDGFPMQITTNHALAALALHGQPFGFTREDVRFVKTGASEMRRDVRDGRFADEAYAAEVIARTESLASRIEALLPPEEPAQ